MKNDYFGSFFIDMHKVNFCYKSFGENGERFIPNSRINIMPT